jgi:hypothetical protein
MQPWPNATRRLLESCLSRPLRCPISNDTAPAQIPNERPQRAVVKPVMDRARITLVAVFPALWLLVSGSYLPAPGDGCPAKCDSTFAFGAGKQCPPYSVCTGDTAARPVNPRIGPQAGNGNVIPLESSFRSHSIERLSAPVFTQRESPLALAVSWQFACRAAPEPRAPSFVS